MSVFSPRIEQVAPQKGHSLARRILDIARKMETTPRHEAATNKAPPESVPVLLNGGSGFEVGVAHAESLVAKG